MPYGLTVPQAWLQPRIVLLDVGARPALNPDPHVGLAPYGLTVPQAWLQPRIVLLDVGARAPP